MTAPGRYLGRRRLRSRRTAQITGAIVLVLSVLMTYLATIAQNGLPWQSRYHVTAEFPNADRLVPTDNVEIGGITVGEVTAVQAIAPAAGKTAYVRVSLALDPSVWPLGVDTLTTIASSSVLGATYVALTPGHSPRKLAAGGTLPLSDTRPTVQLTDLFDIFNRNTNRDIQRTLAEIGPGFAGRGTALNVTISNLSNLLPPLTSLSRLLAAPSTNLRGFLAAYASFTDAVAPVAASLGELVTGGSQTLAALAEQRPALSRVIDDLPSTETTVTSALTRLDPALNRLAHLVMELQPGAALLPSSVAQVNGTLRSGVVPLRQMPTFDRTLSATLSELAKVGRLPSTDGAVRKLRSVVSSARPIVRTLEEGQVYCNIIPPALFNWTSISTAYGVGDGPPVLPFALTNLGASAELLQQGHPSKNLDVNYLPTENSTECASGNEPADGATQHFNNPPGNVGHLHPSTSPPAGVSELAAKVGLLTPPNGWKP
jgi:virulence factor Mce-like protein